MTLGQKGLDELIGSWSGTIADCTLESLLTAMKLAFETSDAFPAALLGLKGYHANIDGFNAVYAFATENNDVQAAAIFEDGKMRVKTSAPDKWDVMVVFKDVHALWKSIFSGGQDIIDSVLANDVQVYGNLNYLLKFGFMARDLKERLGLD
ncbi:MAG: hypothetical protein ACLP5H_02210 [Desulfomonilaceae bacterium]